MATLVCAAANLDQNDSREPRAEFSSVFCVGKCHGPVMDRHGFDKASEQGT